MGDTRIGKARLPQSEPQGLCMTGARTTVHVPPPHYYDVRNADPERPHQRSSFVWAVDPQTGRAVSEEGDVDLKRGAKDDNTPFDWISDLQRDLWDFGYRAHLADKRTGAIPAACEPTGEFDDRLERVVRRFQIHAQLPARRARGGGPMSVPVTYEGGITGVVDDATKREIARWVDHGYRRVLQPFDPEGIFASDYAAGVICPEFYALMTGPLLEAADREDIELYGPAAFSMDKDSHRPRHSRPTWHLVGLAMDVNCYATGAVDHTGVGKPWYHPSTNYSSFGEYDRWPTWEWLRYWAMVREVGLKIAEPPHRDPRHVEWHPLVGAGSQVWNSVPRSIQAFISARGGNTPAEIRRAWGLAVDPKYLASEQAVTTSPRPRARPPNLGRD